jgi:hypothetical protein
MSSTEFDLPDPELQAADPGDLPDELLTDEEKAERQRLVDEEAAAAKERKDAELQANLDKFKVFSETLADAVTRQAAPPQPAPTVPQLPPQPTQEQIDKWNDQLRELQVTNPLQYAAMMREGAVEEAQRRILAGAGGVLDGAAEGFVERFKSTKKGESQFFAQIEKLFDAEIADITPQQLLAMTPDQRKAEFGRRWKAAAGDYFERNAKPVQHLPTSGSSGGRSVAPSSGGRKREKVQELTDGEKLALYRALGKEKALKEIASIEYGLA